MAKPYSPREIGHLKFLIERNRTSTLYELAKQAAIDFNNKRTTSACYRKIKEIMYSRGLDEIDTVQVDGIEFKVKNYSGYLHTEVDGKYVPLHQYIWSREYGVIPEGYHIHHIDNDRFNNNLNNLMLMEASEHISLHFKKKPAETALLFYFLNARGLWTDYLKYRNEVITSFPFPDD